ncbi:DUF4873 domain-containing protein [Streptomyces sp. NBC_00102]|uniref:DUF4873 domain-containing protein n=1 Tax=Streptomyces sp. NBC_00102 TaxID=2975652 RepID=UPI00224DD2F3|nr:DUF4873 domain-containing protein [Streptomyces sp. NBC_00102]MCX5402055.1 DUF4873 domain-containing protein [Streptomyces sp. NBC_00102]
MTDIYEGPATLVIGDEETPVMAALRADSRGTSASWSGTVSADGLQIAFWPAVQSGGVVIRMPDGRRGTAQIDMDAESGKATLSGSGQAPF